MNIRPVCSRTEFKNKKDMDYNFPRAMPSNMIQPINNYNLIDGLNFLQTQNKNTRTTTFNAFNNESPVQQTFQNDKNIFDNNFSLKQSQKFVNNSIDSAPINKIHEQFVDQRAHEDYVRYQNGYGSVPYPNNVPKSTRREKYELNDPSRCPLGRTFGIPENNL
tara:strand:- start:67 stop:555 length:489 start_codon:yes stop_codon:yes gene_type:complete